VATQNKGASLAGFLKSVSDMRRHEDGSTILELLREVTAEQAFMWGNSFVGFVEQLRARTPATG